MFEFRNKQLCTAHANNAQSYWCGCINLLGWIATSAGVIIIVPQLVIAIVISYDSSYVFERWHIFLMYQALNIIFMVYNIFVMKRTAWIHDIGRMFNCHSF